MNICIAGAGYVGLVTGACFAENGNMVRCVDTDNSKISLLKEGIVPFYEPGLNELVARNLENGRLNFTADLSTGLDNAQICFITVGTPSLADGSADLTPVRAVAESIGSGMALDLIVVIKSTVSVGTAILVREIIKRRLSERQQDLCCEIVSNPEFLREGSAVNDFLRPDRVVIGTENIAAAAVLGELYRPFIAAPAAILVMDNQSAELVKYAANAMLATRISFINEIAQLCDKLGGDVENVRRGIGADPRIGFDFLCAGSGYGGSCFPKDLRELIACGRRHGLPMTLACAVERVNNCQKSCLAEMIKLRFGPNLAGRTFGIWGLAFKPHTDDLREAPSVEIIKLLAESGAKLVVYDPAAMAKAAGVFASLGISVAYADDMFCAARDVDAVLLITEWPQFKEIDFRAIKAAMAKPVLFDARNFYDPAEVREAGFEYYCIGRSCYGG